MATSGSGGVIDVGQVLARKYGVHAYDQWTVETSPPASGNLGLEAGISLGFAGLFLTQRQAARRFGVHASACSPDTLKGGHRTPAVVDRRYRTGSAPAPGASTGAPPVGREAHERKQRY